MLAINAVAKTKRIFATLVRIVFVFIFYVVCRLSLLLTCGEILPCQEPNSVQVILSQFLLCKGRGMLHYLPNRALGRISIHESKEFFGVLPSWKKEV